MKLVLNHPRLPPFLQTTLRAEPPAHTALFSAVSEQVSGRTSQPTNRPRTREVKCLQPTAEHVGVFFSCGEHVMSKKMPVTAGQMLGQVGGASPCC